MNAARRFRLPTTRWLGSGWGDAPLGFLEAGQWLTRDVLWLHGWLTDNGSGSLRLRLHVRGEKIEVAADRYSYSRGDLAAFRGACGQVVLVSMKGRVAGARRCDEVWVDVDGRWYRWSTRRGLELELDPREGIALCSRSLSASGVEEFSRFLWAGLAQTDQDDEIFSRHRQRLISSFPPPRRSRPMDDEAGGPAPETHRPCQAEPESPLGWSIDRAVGVDESTLFLRLWLFDCDGVVESLDLLPPTGNPTPLLETLPAVPRPDVEELYRPHFGEDSTAAKGHLGCVGLSHPLTEQAAAPLVELRARGQATRRIALPRLIRDPIAARDEVFRALPVETVASPELVARIVAPAVDRLQARWKKQAEGAESADLGPRRPTNPKASVVIPISRRIDLLQHQVAQFSRDHFLRQCEIVYVADGPAAHRRSVIDLAWACAEQYGVALTVLSVDRGFRGWAAAVNAGARSVRSPFIVTLHSDVLPTSPGWLAPMLARLKESAGRILGARLVSVDGSLQHAGLRFSKSFGSDRLWTGYSPVEGLPADLPLALEPRMVPAVKGACLAIRTDDLMDLGGLDEGYVISGADVDLCLRTRDRGGEVYYEPRSTLYHVAGLNRVHGVGWKRNLWTALYDRWRLSDRWGPELEDLAKEDWWQFGRAAGGSDSP